MFPLLCLLLPLLVSSSPFQYPFQYPVDTLSNYSPFHLLSTYSLPDQLFLEEPSLHESLKTDGSEEFQPLRFTGFKASQQKDGTMNQVVRALEAFLNQKASMKRADKMQYTRMGKRGGDVDSSFPSYKRDVMDKMQYTRMGKRADDMEDGMDKRGDGMDKMQYTRMGKLEDDNTDEMKDSGMKMFLTGNDDDVDEVEDKMMKWGLLAKRENNANKMRFTRMVKRDKMQYTRMGKRNPGADKDLSVNEKEKRRSGKWRKREDSMDKLYVTRMGK